MTEALVAMQVEREPLEETANGEDPVTSTRVSLASGSAVISRTNSAICSCTSRCRDLGIFPPPLSQRLLREFSRVGYRSAPKYEPQHLREEQPGRFERLCYRAVAEGALSEPKTAELLDITVRELTRRMEEPTAAAGE